MAIPEHDWTRLRADYERRGAVLVPHAFATDWLDTFTAELDRVISDIRAGRRAAQSASRDTSGAGSAKIPVCEDHDGYLRLLNV
ncbi:MAG TPA: hypothetical protein PK159_05465, partial [Steroidobacteraceae bacterium]|nr:hypothetical protein [Steroidobacteraceae bacterium]